MEKSPRMPREIWKCANKSSSVSLTGSPYAPNHQAGLGEPGEKELTQKDTLRSGLTTGRAFRTGFFYLILFCLNNQTLGLRFKLDPTLDH